MLALLLGLLLAFGGVILLGPTYIRLLQRLGFGGDPGGGPASHHRKKAATLGGMLIVLVVMFLAMYAWRISTIPMLTLVGVAILGAIDDYVNTRPDSGCGAPQADGRPSSRSWQRCASGTISTSPPSTSRLSASWR
jgi:UDP-N-acetylmuramyl pentapeptide phosphotransferase/UDP-N-acetylglucosamine-1-phosphate transferase